MNTGGKSQFNGYHQFWDDLYRHEYVVEGIITGNRIPDLPCTAYFRQLFNGRIVFSISPQEQNVFKLKLLDLSSSCYNFIGTLENGREVKVQNIRHTTEHFPSFNQGMKLTGSLSSDNYLDIISSNFDVPPAKVVVEVTNLLLYRRHHLKFEIDYAKIEISLLEDYQRISELISVINTAGVLSRIVITPNQEQSVEELSDFVRRLCHTLSFSQRSYIFPTAIYWYDQKGEKIYCRYQCPVYDISKASQPLILEEFLRSFVQCAINRSEEEYENWNLINAQEHYLQAMSITSVWSQSVGFFTALESIKSGFVNQPGREHLDRYVSRNQFRKKEIASKILDILADNFDEYKYFLNSQDDENLNDEEREQRKAEISTIKSKVGELNRPAYKLVLRKMFKSLGVSIEDEDLKKLVDLRNQIIHNGNPNDNIWNGPEAYRWACNFARLVECIILALLGYDGEANTYDKIVNIIDEEIVD